MVAAPPRSMSIPSQEDATSRNGPAWLTRWESMLAEAISEEDETETDFLRVFRRLLEAPGHDDQAVERAADEIKAYYKEHYNADPPGFSQMPERGARYVMEIVSSNAFDLSKDVFPGEFNHNRLGSLLIKLKTDAAEVFDPTNPELGYNAMGLLMVARDHWNHDHGLVRGKEPSVAKCDKWIAISSIIARLLGEDMFGEDEEDWANADIEECLQSFSSESRLSELVRNCHILVAANWVLLAGIQLAAGVKSGADEVAQCLDSETCKKLAAKFEEIANRSDDLTEGHNPAHWKLKETVIKARQKLMELDPKALHP